MTRITAAATSDQQVFKVKLTLRDWLYVLVIVGVMGGYLANKDAQSAATLSTVVKQGDELMNHSERLNYHDAVLIQKGLITPNDLMN